MIIQNKKYLLFSNLYKKCILCQGITDTIKGTQGTLNARKALIAGTCSTVLVCIIIRSGKCSRRDNIKDSSRKSKREKMREEEEAEVEVKVRIGGGETETEEVEAVVGNIAETGVAEIVGVQVAGKVEIENLEHHSEEGPDPHNADRQ